MGVVNYGQQVLTFSYGQEARAKGWNKLNYEIIPPGIYSGGLLNLTGINQVSLDPLVCYINDDNTKIGVNVQTTTSVNLIVSPSAPYIILRMIWIDTVNVFMDVLSIDYGSLLPTDLIVGKAIYVNGIIQSFFDYALRSNALFTILSNRNSEFLVSANDEAPTNQVQVSGGTFITNKKFITVTSGPSPALTDTIQGRIDLIYIDDNGAIQKVEGVDAISPTIPNYHGRMVIAEIHRGPTRSTIESEEIILINFKNYAIGSMAIDTYFINWGTSGNQINANTIPIVSTAFGTQTIENALQVIANRSNKSSIIAAGAINAGKVVVQSQNGVKQFSTTPQLGTAYNLPTNTTQLPFGQPSLLLQGTNQVFQVYQDSLDTGKLKAVIGTINSDNSITWHTPVTIDSATTTTGAAWIYQIDSNKVIICYEAWNTYRHVSMVACSISGAIITKGNILTPTDVPTQAHDLLAFGVFDSTHFFVAYEEYVFQTTSYALFNAVSNPINYSWYNYASFCNLITLSGITLSSGSKTVIDALVTGYSANGIPNSGAINFPSTIYKNSAIVVSLDTLYYYSFPLNKVTSGNNYSTQFQSRFVTIKLISGGSAISASSVITTDSYTTYSGTKIAYGSYSGPPTNVVFTPNGIVLYIPFSPFDIQISYKLNKNYTSLWGFLLTGNGTEASRFARLSNESTLNYTDFFIYNILSGLNPWANSISVASIDANTFIIIRLDTSGNLISIVFKIVGESFVTIDKRTLISGIFSNAALLCIDKTRFLLSYSDATNSNIVKSRVVEFLDIPSSIIGIATNTVTTGQNCIVAYGKLIDGLSGLTPDASVYPAADGTPTSSNTINIPIGKAITSTEMITNIMSTVSGV